MQNLVNTQMVAALDINVLEQVSRHLSVSPNTDPKRVIELTTRQVRIPVNVTTDSGNVTRGGTPKAQAWSPSDIGWACRSSKRASETSAFMMTLLLPKL